jgi:hypothetical protein
LIAPAQISTDAGRNAGLYLAECTFFSTQASMYLDYLTLTGKCSGIGAKRFALTHMREEMLVSHWIRSAPAGAGRTSN